MMIYYKDKPPVNLNNVEFIKLTSYCKTQILFNMGSGETVFWTFNNRQTGKEVLAKIKSNHFSKITIEGV